MSLTVPARIAQIAEHFARHNSHGYSQPNRGTGSTESVKLSDGSCVTVTNSDVDCSEMVRQCVNAAISGSYNDPISYMWTGDEDQKLRAIGFTRIPYSDSTVKRGDVLWVSGHTGIALGDGKQADAHGDEIGGITGPKRGDQTGHEVEIRSLRSWTCAYRYSGSGSADDNNVIKAEFEIVVNGDTNVRSDPSIDSDNITGVLPMGNSIICDGILEANDRVWGTYISNSGARRYVSIGNAHGWVTIR